MPTIIEAVWTIAGIENMLQAHAGGASVTIDSFKVGEGGWENLPSGVFPRNPADPGPLLVRGPYLTDLDVIMNPADYSGSSSSFQKALTAPDFSYAAQVLEITCLLDFGEYNDDGFGNAPEIFEIGVFAGLVLVAYGTFPMQVKTVANQIPNIFRLAASGA